MTKPGDLQTKKTINELVKEFPDKTYRELEIYRDADRIEEAATVPLTAAQKNLVEHIEDLNAALVKKSEEIKDNNTNRGAPKFKGAEDIFSDYANSVVYIGNWQKGKWIGSGSGFVVNYKGLKIITNWHVIDDAEKIDVWLKPKKMVDESFLFLYLF